jgi:ubiquinone/menaquinone biosynthesis C-methylase UbiE
MNMSVDNNQKSSFLSDEGNNWFSRNKIAIHEKITDPVINLLRIKNIHPRVALEIGCADGYRLNDINKEFKSSCYGIDPSLMAIEEGRKAYDKIVLAQGTADQIPFANVRFDLIIFGFCLYLCDRDDLFKIVYEADRFLEENGFIIIYDFEPDFPFKNNYKYANDMYSYKMRYANLFLSNPSYTLISKDVFTHFGQEKMNDPNERISVSLLYKNTSSAYVKNPYNG